MKATHTQCSVFFGSELFRRVQSQHLFSDSKTFADAIPKVDIEEILERYTAQSKTADFDLNEFVQQHFKLDEPKELTDDSQSQHLDGYFEAMWELLQGAQFNESSISLIPLKHPYIVPGGRFREIYYWDSYFTSLGLIRAGKTELVKAMVNNFIDIQSSHGLIPNGNRYYYLSRSQPPVLALMIEQLMELVQESKQELTPEQIKHWLKGLEDEYQFWMKGENQLDSNNNAINRVVRLLDGSLLNRYWDDEATPRPESFSEDKELAEKLNEAARPNLYRNIRAGCESGWDFSSRWLNDPESLLSIQTTHILPVDLNCLLLKLEQTIAELYLRVQNNVCAEHYTTLASRREAAINRYFWNKNQGFYFDYDFVAKVQTSISSLAASLPLFIGIATQTQVSKVAKHINNQFLMPGGLVTTTCSTSQQWDSPNGWAPLQWFTVKGLLNYGQNELAKEIMTRWLDTVETGFKTTGKVMEKYNVVDPDLLAGGGEYEVQAGFGWTNGVCIEFKALLNQNN
ncbi:alpha,alpha-trehalase TreF [Psychrosphaera ytuae]|uniref:Alpha,alpha-trehalase TreF n=1 Tax=Psychrosphaera ytuae TaxID=2820710 RepID=A0A975D9N6_9GAMM|nr:alpha,alpha-trehalase TreF [Psychrosphaera ytuae]QTH63082.1 alpha,alpha-trehalase TreF [Psychrosphaera ytuae]